MAINRKNIKDAIPGVELEDSAVKALLDLIHNEVDSLKDANDDLQKQLDEAKAEAEKHKTAKEKAESDLSEFKQNQEKEKTRTAKIDAATEYFKNKGITIDNSLKLAIRSAKSEIDGLELGKDGKVKDFKALDDLIAGDLSGLVSTTTEHGVNTKNPAGNAAGKYTSRADIMKIKDASERQKAIAENPHLFGIDS